MPVFAAYLTSAMITVVTARRIGRAGFWWELYAWGIPFISLVHVKILERRYLRDERTSQ